MCPWVSWFGVLLQDQAIDPSVEQDPRERQTSGWLSLAHGGASAARATLDILPAHGVLATAAPAPERDSDIPLRLVITPFPRFAEAVDLWEEGSPLRVEDDDVIVDLSRAALIVPNVIIEGAAALLLPERVRSNGYVLLDRGGGSEDLVGLFVRHLLKRERSFFAKIGESPLVTADVEDGSGEIDSHDFDEHQVRVMLDSLKKAARERFGIASLDLDSAVKLASSGSWADVLLVPAAVAAYGARFGIDRTWTFSEEVRIQFHLERGSRIYRTLGQDSHHNIGSLAVNLFGLPVGVLLSLDARAGRLETGFIGIGTSLSAMLEAIAGCEEGPR